MTIRDSIARIVDPQAFSDVGCTVLKDELAKLASDIGTPSRKQKAYAITDQIMRLIHDA